MSEELEELKQKIKDMQDEIDDLEDINDDICRQCNAMEQELSNLDYEKHNLKEVFRQLYDARDNKESFDALINQFYYEYLGRIS